MNAKIEPANTETVEKAHGSSGSRLARAFFFCPPRSFASFAVLNAIRRSTHAMEFRLSSVLLLMPLSCRFPGITVESCPSTARFAAHRDDSPSL